jgi:hypothetical protein
MIILRDADRSVEGVAQSIKRLAEDAVLRCRMSDGADKVAATLLDWNALIERTIRFNNHRSNRTAVLVRTSDNGARA